MLTATARRQPPMPVLRNPKYERFAQLVALGVKLADAYRDAGFEAVRAKTRRSGGGRLMGRPLIRARVSELQARAADNVVLTLKGKRELLAEFALNPRSDLRSRLEAIRLDSQLAGEFAAEKHAHLFAQVPGSGQVIDQAELARRTHAARLIRQRRQARQLTSGTDMSGHGAVAATPGQPAPTSQVPRALGDA